MNCLNCQTANSETARFCANCGHSLTQVCPNCSTENPIDANFCSNCGERLPVAEPAAPASQDKLLQYIPKELLAKLESARAGQTMAGERRVVTILFCDVKGSTAAAEQLDPEDWAEIMNGAFEHLIAPVYRYEGTLARLMGDAVLAFFGAPIAHEDDPERAVLAGLGIVEGIEPYREQVRERWDLDFDVRVGINTGLVVVGEVGSDLRMEYTAMGDAVNLASRMEQTAQPGTIQVAEETYQRVAPLFEFEPLGEIEVKGKQAPVLAYRAAGRKARPRRLRGIQGLAAPLVGRAREMDALQESLQDLRQGRGGIVFLIGEAGLGKSRMIDELRSAFDLQGAYWAESRGISYETNHPYGQFQQQLRLLWGLGEGDEAQLVRDRLTKVLADLPDAERGPAIQALELLLLGGSEPTGGGLEGETLKRQLFATSLVIWRTQMETAPTVLVFDDLHWADSASTELLTHLFQLTDSGPILFLCAFRSDRNAPSWQVKQAAEVDFPHRYQEIELGPLSDASSKELVDELLMIAELPPKLHEVIQERAEGNPFFVEEVIRTLIDSGAVVHDEEGAHWTASIEVNELAIPDNLQSLLISRMDRLDGDVRRTLQLASVIGRSFYFRVLQSISHAGEELDGHLSVLQRVELILEAARDPEREYAFRHALTQEAAYRSILRKERTSFHLQVGESLEQLFPERKSEFAPLLAHHFLQADDDRGAEYSVVAGDEAFRMYALEAAVRHYQNALEISDSDSLKHVYTRLGRSHELLGDFDGAVNVYRSMAEVGRKQKDGEMELVALTQSASIFATPTPLHSQERARELSDEAIELAHRVQNHEAEARILWNRSNSEKFAGEAEIAVEYADRSLAIAEEYGLQEQQAFTLNDIGASLMILGELERSREAAARSHEMWRKLDNKPMLADNLQVQAAYAYWVGEFEQVMALAQEAYQMARAIDNLWGQSSALIWLSLAYADAGQFDQALEAQEECLRNSRQMGTLLPQLVMAPSLALTYGSLGEMKPAWESMESAFLVDRNQFRNWWPFVWSCSARLHLLAGDLPAARKASDQSYIEFKPVGSIHMSDGVFMADAEIALAEGRPEHALERLDELLKLAEQTGRRHDVPEALMFRALSLSALGKTEGAREDLQRAREQAEELGSGRILWRILLEQSRLEAADGNSPKAAELGTQAKAAVSGIIDSLSDPDLQQSFESLPDVQEALAS
ncbi:MAG: AAA family ATPase [Chloroflexi bacterium]|nr:AAA family ATPase [Chloroflexota bacterium]